MVFVVVSAVLVIVDLRVTTDQAVLGLDWAYGVILFWGLDLAGPAISVIFDSYRVTKGVRRVQGAPATHTGGLNASIADPSSLRR